MCKILLDGAGQIEKLPTISISLQPSTEQPSNGVNRNTDIHKGNQLYDEAINFLKMQISTRLECRTKISVMHFLTFPLDTAGNSAACTFPQPPSVAAMTTTFRESYQGLYAPPAPSTRYVELQFHALPLSPFVFHPWRTLTHCSLIFLCVVVNWER